MKVLHGVDVGPWACFSSGDHLLHRHLIVANARNLPANSSQAHDAEDLAFEFLTDGRLPTTGSDPVAFGDDVTHAR